MTYDIIAIGSATRDVFLKSEHFEVEHLKLGSKVEVDELYVASGGAGTNTAVTFARQGFATSIVGVIGKDPNGDDIVREMQAEGVDDQFLMRHDDAMTAYSAVLVDPSGERTILTYKGEGQHFDKVHIPWSDLRATWFYLSSLGGHADVLQMAVQAAQACGAKIAFNPGGKELEMGLDALKPIFLATDILFMNKDEAEQLGDVFSVAKNILSISDGPNGVMVHTKEGAYSAGVPDSPVIERTGAGDAFGSGFVAEYMREGNIEKAIQYGTANASSVVTRFGAKAGILKKGDRGPWELVSVNRKS